MCADIKAAFDSIPTEKLETVISSLFKKQEYAMLKYRMPSALETDTPHEKLRLPRKMLKMKRWISHTRIHQDRRIPSSQTDTNTAATDDTVKGKKLPVQSFHQTKATLVALGLSKRSPGSVSIDLGKTRTTCRHQALNTLREHLGNTLVKSHGSLYRQKIGIPQGSILSTKLCALFCSIMEQTQSMAAFETEDL